MAEEMEKILDIRGLSIAFTQYDRGFAQKQLHTIRDLSLSVREREIVAVVGSSGSGKSLLAHGILGILPYNAAQSGTMLFCGEPLCQARQKQARGHEIALVPQSVAYLDPLMKIGRQVCGGGKGKAIREKARSVLAQYGLGAEVEAQYPFELSGGMARRVLTATAVMEQPKLIIADEPTPGLHLSAAKRVMTHFRELADKGAGILLITHDLELALEVADRIVVFYAGMTLEEASTQDFCSPETLRHPYTRALWHAMPRNGFHFTPSAQPSAETLQGCPFAPRCPVKDGRCAGQIPYQSVRGGYVRCVQHEQEQRL